MRRKRRGVEFSKLVLALVLTTYFVGVGIGAYVVMQLDSYQLGVWLAFVGTPVSVAIGFYSWKARAENMVKLGWNRDKAGETDTYTNASAMMRTRNTVGPFIEP